MILVSLATNQLESYRLIRTTFWTRKNESTRPDEFLESINRFKQSKIISHHINF